MTECKTWESNGVEFCVYMQTPTLEEVAEWDTYMEDDGGPAEKGNYRVAGAVYMRKVSSLADKYPEGKSVMIGGTVGVSTGRMSGYSLLVASSRSEVRCREDEIKPFTDAAWAKRD